LRRLARRHPASAGASPHAAAASACRREPMPPPASYRVDGATLGREMELMRLWKEIRKRRKKMKRKKGNILFDFRNCDSQILFCLLLLHNEKYSITDI
jgi:hypothetical protein